MEYANEKFSWEKIERNPMLAIKAMNFDYTPKLP